MCVDFRDRSADPTYKNGVHSIGIFLFFFFLLKERITKRVLQLQQGIALVALRRSLHIFLKSSNAGRHELVYFGVVYGQV